MLLADRTQLLRDVLEGLQLLAVLLDAEGRILFCNEALLRTCGYLREEAVGQDWYDLFVPAGERETRRSEHRAGPPTGAVERLILARDGDPRLVRWNVIALRDPDGRVQGCASIGDDVTESRRASEKLLHDAFHDSLTGLPNRALFMDRLAHLLLLEKRRPSASFSVLFLDVDRFKVINDSLGHVCGDELLVQVGRRLKSLLRPADTVARLGGDEFTVLLEDVPDRESARSIAGRLQEELRQPFVVAGQEVFSGVSIGIAHGSPLYQRPEDILRDADTALYRAKAEGRGRWVEFDASMHERAVALLQLETDLRRALERGELLLHYQAVVSLETGRIAGAEALVRWQHPQRGLVPPSEFIPLAEETGLVVSIGAWVLREACRQMKAWQERFPDGGLQIGVNLSSRQLQAPGLVAEVATTLKDTGLPPRSLRLEVTESLLMDKHPLVSRTMAGLRALGVHIDLDDFGTGYSSLSYLHQFPIDTLKIDRSFVSRMGTTGEGLQIVNTMLSLAKSLDMEVVAEGVENAEQLQLLRNLHVAYAQGYHLCRPLDGQGFEALLAEDRSWAA